MYSVQPFTNATYTQLTVGNTAKSLQTLIREASSDATYLVDQSLDALDVQVQSGKIRYLVGNTPTGSIGFILDAAGISVRTFRGESIHKVMFIRDTAEVADATISIEIGRSK